MKLVVNGRTLYARDGIERWLEDDHRTWQAPDFVQSGPGGPALPIGLIYDGARHASKTTGLSGFRGARLKPRLVFDP